MCRQFRKLKTMNQNRSNILDKGIADARSSPQLEILLCNIITKNICKKFVDTAYLCFKLLGYPSYQDIVCLSHLFSISISI